MSIAVKRFDDAQEAMAFLEELAYTSEKYVFRGHRCDSFGLVTTWERKHRTPVVNLPLDLDHVISDFRAGLARIGKVPFESENRQDWLELARHYDVPTPVLDFTYSPYIALFFAFSGNEGYSPFQEEKEYVAVYSLDMLALAVAYTSLKLTSGEDEPDFTEKYWRFLEPSGLHP